MGTAVELPPLPHYQCFYIKNHISDVCIETAQSSSLLVTSVLAVLPEVSLTCSGTSPGTAVTGL